MLGFRALELLFDIKYMTHPFSVDYNQRVERIIAQLADGEGRDGAETFGDSKGICPVVLEDG